ncbi:MAG: hypothetical protein FJX11_19385 [Alphaproteobacteria bacterium]|nr:hypothetical protein [Alphaproteobacteria bacterium]
MTKIDLRRVYSVTQRRYRQFRSLGHGRRSALWLAIDGSPIEPPTRDPARSPLRDSPMHNVAAQLVGFVVVGACWLVICIDLAIRTLTFRNSGNRG